MKLDDRISVETGLINYEKINLYIKAFYFSMIASKLVYSEKPNTHDHLKNIHGRFTSKGLGENSFFF